MREVQDLAAGRCARGKNGEELQHREARALWTSVRGRNCQKPDNEQDRDDDRPKQACTGRSERGVKDD
jgi:hypothetical protein